MVKLFNSVDRVDVRIPRVGYPYQIPGGFKLGGCNRRSVYFKDATKSHIA